MGSRHSTKMVGWICLFSGGFCRKHPGLALIARVLTANSMKKVNIIRDEC